MCSTAFVDKNRTVNDRLNWPLLSGLLSPLCVTLNIYGRRCFGRSITPCSFDSIYFLTLILPLFGL